MRRQILVTLSAAALTLFCSPAMNAQSDNAQSTGRQWSSAPSAQTSTTNSNWNNQQSQNSNNSGNSAQAQKEASEMVPAHASLEKTIDAKKCQPGETVQAKLGENVQLKNGPNLPDGTVLTGTVTADRTQPDGTRLALRFTQAKLTDGTTVPIKAMVVAIAPPSAQMPGMGNDAIPARDVWNSHTYQVDQEGAVSGADLHSNVTGTNSAVIVSHKKDNVKIGRGSRLDMAIAEQSNWHAHGNHNNSNPSM